MKTLKIKSIKDERINEDLIDLHLSKFVDLKNGINYKIGSFHYDVNIDLPTGAFSHLKKELPYVISYT